MFDADVTQGHWNWCHSKAWVRFPIHFLWSSYSPSIVTMVISCVLFDAGKTRMIGLLYGEKTVTICWAVFHWYRNVTDRQTGRQTDRFAISISRVSMLTSDKNWLLMHLWSGSGPLWYVILLHATCLSWNCGISEFWFQQRPVFRFFQDNTVEPVPENSLTH